MSRFDKNVMPNTPELNVSDILHLNCWILGDNTRRAFSVKIAQSEIVDALKDVIKNKKKHTFDAIDANLLDLWKVSSCGSDAPIVDDITADSPDF
jgi:hypothetical protein